MSSSESKSGSDSEPEFESIIATRARRSNAGSRLRQLLDLEETNAGLQVATEDDENVNLLFEEDEDDGEFEASDDDEMEEEEEGDDNDDNDDNNGKKTEARLKNKPRDTRKEQEESKNAANEYLKSVSDEMLSESEISASDSDEEEGEKELQQQERLRKRRKRNTGLPAAAQKKRPKTTTQAIRRQQKHKTERTSIVDVVPIAPHQRRHSSRSATVKSSIATHEKMEKEFEKRQVVVPAAKKEYVEKTLEERLEEAKTTEKENMLSLTKFYEQEIQKKKKQRDLANSRKYRMTNYIRLWSNGVYITPYDEIAEIQEEKRLRQEEEEKKQRRKLAYLKRKQTRLGIKDDSLVLAELEREAKEKETAGNSIDVRSETTEGEATEEFENEATIKTTDIDTENQNDKLLGIPYDQGNFEDNENIAMKAEDIKFQETGLTAKTEEVLEPEHIIEKEEKTMKLVRFDESAAVEEPRDNSQLSEERQLEEETIMERKQTVNLEREDEEFNTPKVVYEGPALKTTRTYLIFKEFDERLSTDDIKTYLFGRQSLLSGTRRDPNAEPICIIKCDESSNLDLQKIRDARSESLKALMKLPKFGETVVLTEDDNDESNDNDNVEVKIHTPAPIGIHLPDGNKKMCLITGMPAVYYDPNTGTPYATVDAFKIMKGIIDGEYDWIQLDNGGINSRIPSGIGYYVNGKDTRHANGVPEGF